MQRLVLRLVAALVALAALLVSAPSRADDMAASDALWAVRLDLAGANEIEVIKVVRTITMLGLREANDLVNRAPVVVLDELGRPDADLVAGQLRAAGAAVSVIPDGTVSAPPPGAAPSPPTPSPTPAPPSPAPPSSRKATSPAERRASRGIVLLYDVVLEGAGPRKLDVIAYVKNLRGLDLREAKLFVESAPKAVLSGASRDNALVTKRALDDLSAMSSLVVAGRQRRTVAAPAPSPSASTPPPAPPAASSAPPPPPPRPGEVPAPRIAAPPKLGPPPSATTTYRVVLVGAGANKLDVITVVRQLTGLGLREAKDLVDRAPSVIRQGVNKSDADLFAQKLRERGAAVDVKNDP